MNIKIACPCGSHYEFDVEPVNARMPGPVSCPDCDADGTGLANEIIVRQLAPPMPGRASRFAPNPQVLIPIVSAAFAVFAILWGFHRFYLSQPRTVYSEKIPEGQQRIAYRMISPTEIISADARQIRLFDLTRRTQRWATDFTAATAGNTDSEPPAIEASKASARTGEEKEPDMRSVNPGAPAYFNNDDEGFFPSGPQVQATSTEVWLISRGRLAHFDRQTGRRKEDIRLPRTVLHRRHDANSLVAMSAPDDTRRVLTRVSFATGEVETEEVKLASPAPPTKRRWFTAVPPGKPPADDSRDELLMAGPTVVRMQVKLIEEKYVTYEAMAPKKGPTALESGNLTSGGSLAAVLEEANEMTRHATGGKAQENQSRYQVTLHRWLAQDAPDWTGEITGPPAFHALKTVDVVTGVRSLTVLDKANRKLWESKLTQPFSRDGSSGFGFDDDAARGVPFVEHGDDLYVTDAGTLTRFSLKTGEAKWRLTSVGISRVLIDVTGQIYLTSTTASPDSIQHWQQIDISNRPKPVILKVDPATGKALWQIEDIADKIMLSGKYLYASRTSMDRFSMLSTGAAPKMHFNLHRINPSSGGTLWRHYENREPLRMDFEGRVIMLHFKDELKVLTYFSL